MFLQEKLGEGYPLNRFINMYSQFIKPLFDRVLAMVGLVLASPFMIVTALLVYTFISRKVLFTQERIGYRAKPFILYKFRTLKTDQYYLKEGDAIPRVGRIIRATGLDELPQFFNVLLGQLSLVGPRPLLPEYLPLYNEGQAKRHDVKPGITGLAQVSGRNSISWESRFEYDVEYVKKQSFRMDFFILVRTCFALFSKSSSAPATPFKGNNNADPA